MLHALFELQEGSSGGTSALKETPAGSTWARQLIAGTISKANVRHAASPRSPVWS